jgi:hypothetical protein
MKTIHKYTLVHRRWQEIQMPEGASILCAQIQHGQVRLWAEVDSTAPLVPRMVCMLGTGHPEDEPAGKYAGTCQLLNGDLVVHIFVKDEDPLSDPL